jgi:hypothetical protein
MEHILQKAANQILLNNGIDGELIAIIMRLSKAVKAAN